MKEQWEIEFDEKFGKVNDPQIFDDDAPEMRAFKEAYVAMSRKWETAVKEFIREKIQEVKDAHL